MRAPSSLLLLGTTLALGCGAPEPTSGANLGFELFVDRAVIDELGAFQVVVLPDGRARRCADLQSTCLHQQVKATEPLLLGSSGKQVRSVRFPAGLSGGAQSLEIDLPVGRDYVVVIEALSRSSPPRFLGSSCNYLESVSATRNEPLIAAPITLATTNACDPTFPP